MKKIILLLIVSLIFWGIWYFIIPRGGIGLLGSTIPIVIINAVFLWKIYKKLPEEKRSSGFDTPTWIQTIPIFFLFLILGSIALCLIIVIGIGGFFGAWSTVVCGSIMFCLCLSLLAALEYSLWKYFEEKNEASRSLPESTPVELTTSWLIAMIIFFIIGSLFFLLGQSRNISTLYWWATFSVAIALFCGGKMALLMKNRTNN